MMHSLSALKQTSDQNAAQIAKERQEQKEREKLQEESRLTEELKNAKQYVPSAPIELKTAPHWVCQSRNSNQITVS